MKFFTIVTLLAAAAVAIPLENAVRSDGDWWGDGNPNNDHSSGVCPEGLYNRPQCCDYHFLGIFGLHCHTPFQVFYDLEDLRKECSKSNGVALCCLAPPSDRAVECQLPLE
ncbi:hydrophobin [Trichoderma sp. SZMC 28013]